MADRPILFNDAMVRAIMAGTKTQTRRRVKGHALDFLTPPIEFSPDFVSFPENDLCPYGRPGDRLWVREAWARDDEDGCLMYRADVGSDVNADAWEQWRREGVQRYRWRPSIHMPRKYSRITLEVTGVRVERLQQISAADCWAEGIASSPDVDPVHEFRDLWESINGPGSWNANPWVWVVEFRKVGGGNG